MIQEEMTKKELAEIAGYTYRRLYDIDMALPEKQKLFVQAENSSKYSLSLFVQRWVAYNVGRGETENLDLDEVRALHEQVKKEKTELEVARMRGQLIDIDEVRRLWGGIANTVMQNMVRLPSKIAPQVTAMDNVDMIMGIIDREIRDVLTAISETPVPEDILSAEAAAENEDDE